MEPKQDEFGQPLNGFRYMGEVKQPVTLPDPVKIKFTKEQVRFLESQSNQISINGDKPYQFIPCWFKETERKNVFEVWNLDYLPKELLDEIARLREE